MYEKEKVKRSKFKLIMVMLLVVAFALFVALELLGNGNFINTLAGGSEFVETDISLAYDSNSKASFFTYAKKDGFFYATKDGISFIDSSGLESMSRTYNMSNPVMTGEGSVAAVLEKNGNDVYVYNTDGEMYQVKTPYPILNYSVNAMGYVSVILKKDDNYIINVFNDRGNLQSEGSLVYKNKMPIATALSNDGRILAICFLDSSNVEINSYINFYYLNPGEANEYKSQDGLFTFSGDNTDQIIGLIKFMDNNELIAVSDKEISIYQPEKKPVKKAALPLSNKISAISFNTNCFAVAYGAPFLNQPSEKEGFVDIYDLGLSKIGEFKASSGVDYLAFGLNSLIIGEGRKFSAVTDKGGLLWEYTALHDVKQLLFLGNTSKILVAGTTEAIVMKMEKQK